MNEKTIREIGAKWLTKIGLPKNVVEDFEVNGTVWMSEAGHDVVKCNDRTKEYLRRAEAESGCTALFAIEQFQSFGLCFNVFVIPSYEEDLPLCEEDLDRNLALAYVLNETAPMCSELGTIEFKKTHGGYVRLA